MKKLSIIALLVLMVMVPAALFAGGASEKGPSDEWVFAADATWPPLEFIDENGVYTGFEVELVPLIGEKVGYNFVSKNIPWDTIFAGLKNGNYDAVASGVTVTDERKLTMDFSMPILSAGQVVIVPADSAVKSIDDLEGKKIGVQIGTTGDFALEEYPVKIAKYDDIGLAIEDMLNGNVSAAVCDSLIASEFVLGNEGYAGKLKIAGEPFTTEDIAIAVTKGNTELLDLINKGLQMAMDDGSFDALKAKWNLL